MESMPTMIAQASKKQRCMNIELETGTAQYVEEDSSENEERLALSNLGLWKYAGYESMPSFLSVDGSKNDTIDLTDPESELNGELKVEAIRQKSIQNSHKGYMECSLLLGLTDLINNQEYLTLQTCSRPAILPRGIALPTGQVVEIRRKEYNFAENVIVSGLTAAKRVMSERRVFAKGVLEIRKNWRVLSHSAILATKKHLQQRVVPLDGRVRDTLYIDCSYVSSGDKLSNLDEFLVPLGIGPRGPILGGDEKEIICKTLKITMKHRSTGEIIASATSWGVNQHDVPKTDLDSSAECSAESLPDKESSTEMKVEGNTEAKTADFEECAELDNNFMPLINAHCERRQHDAMSKRLFARLRYNINTFTSLPFTFTPAKSIPGY
jgi:ribosome-associated protein YbcJ (S4-like RNA binding protein)